MGGVVGPNLRCRILRCIQLSIGLKNCVLCKASKYNDLLQFVHRYMSRMNSSVPGGKFYSFLSKALNWATGRRRNILQLPQNHQFSQHPSILVDFYTSFFYPEFLLYWPPEPAGHCTKMGYALSNWSGFSRSEKEIDGIFVEYLFLKPPNSRTELKVLRHHFSFQA